MNIERPTSNFEWEKMKKQTYGGCQINVPLSICCESKRLAG